MNRVFILSIFTLVAAQAIAVPSNMSQRRAGHVLVAGGDGRLYAIGGDADAEKASAEAFDPTTNSWKPVAAPAEKRFGAGAAAIGNRIYLLGGARNWSASEKYAADILVLDVTGGEWSVAGTLKYPRTGIAATTVGGKVYTVGGTGIRHSSPAPAITPDPKDPRFLDAIGVRITEEFDPAGGVSTALASIPRRRQGAALVAGRDGLVYALGGDFWGDFFGYPDFSTAFGVRYINGMVEALDPKTGQWQSVARMRTPRTGLAAVTGADGRIYTFGGATKEDLVATVEAYDPATQTWQELAPLSRPRGQAAAALGRDGKIYVVGGRTAAGATESVEAYNPATNTWEASPPPPPGTQLDFATLDTQFSSAEAKSVTFAEAIGWRAGRCYRKSSPSEALGGLLVGYESGSSMKIGVLATDGLPADYFDTITAEKRTKILSAIEGMDARLSTAIEANGYLASKTTLDSSRTAEYQLKQLGDNFLSRVVIETKTAEGNVGRSTTVHCFHRRPKL